MLTQGWGDFITWLEGHQASSEVFVAIAALVVTAVLVWVTIAYVGAARQQANASVKMAGEMREQRLSTGRPNVLLCPLAEERGQEKIRLALKGPLPDCTPVRLTNVGSGIAAGVNVPYRLEGADPKERIIDYLLPGSSETEEFFYLSPVENAENRRVLRIGYCDVFGNCFESTREFHKEPSSNHYVFTRLVHREVPQ